MGVSGARGLEPAPWGRAWPCARAGGEHWDQAGQEEVGRCCRNPGVTHFLSHGRPPLPPAPLNAGPRPRQAAPLPCPSGGTVVPTGLQPPAAPPPLPLGPARHPKFSSRAHRTPHRWLFSQMSVFPATPARRLPNLPVACPTRYKLVILTCFHLHAYFGPLSVNRFDGQLQFS